MCKLFLVVFSCLLLCQCKSITASGPLRNPPVKQLAVVNNSDVFMDDFQTEMVNQISAMGINTTVVATPPAKGDYLTYTAFWTWDLGMFLSHFKATLHRPNTAERSVVYENGGLDFSKFGEFQDKIPQPLHELFHGKP